MQCLKLSEAAYKRATENPIKNNIKYFQNDFGFSWYNNNILYISFRGTYDVSDMLTDFDLYMTDNVHAGFLDHFNSIKDEVEACIIDYPEKQEVIFTGHSLGGSCATLAGHYFSNQYPTINFNVYTFGSPKVGNQTFVDEFNARVAESTRIFLEEDPVPMLPLGLYYCHVNNGMCLKPATGFPVNVADHNCCEYENAISSTTQYKLT